MQISRFEHGFLFISQYINSYVHRNLCKNVTSEVCKGGTKYPISLDKQANIPYKLLNIPIIVFPKYPMSLKILISLYLLNPYTSLTLTECKQEGHSGPDLLTCTLCTSYISLCDPCGGQPCPQGHYLNKLGSGPLGDDTYQISRF